MFHSGYLYPVYLAQTTPEPQITNIPEIDISITISVIVALCAIVSPILTAIINNCHQTKIKKLELSEERYKNTVVYKREIFENYLKFAGRCIAYSDDSALQEYGKYYLLALMYAPSHLQQEMIETHDLMRTYHWPEATRKFEELTPKIHAILQQL